MEKEAWSDSRLGEAWSDSRLGAWAVWCYCGQHRQEQGSSVLGLITPAPSCCLAPCPQQEAEQGAEMPRIQPRIVGGLGAPRGRFPYMVYLYGGGFLCGGTLVAPGVVLTAGHCSNFELAYVALHSLDDEVGGHLPTGSPAGLFSLSAPLGVTC